MKPNPIYTTIFSSTIKPLISEEKDKYLAMASLLDVGEFLPEIDTQKNVDLLPVAFNACVANRVNKNGDAIDTETALKICDSLIRGLGPLPIKKSLAPWRYIYLRKF